MIRLVPRAQPSKLMGFIAPLIALAVTLLAGLVLFALLGVPVGKAFYAFSPLIMIAVALSIGYVANVWNIGAEGQLILGGICGGSVALYFYEVDAWYVLPLMMLAGVLGGMLWAGIPALLRTKFNANEILTSLMLTYIAALLLSMLVHGVLRDPDGFNFPESRLFHDAATLPIIIDGTRLHIGALLALLIVVIGWVLLSRTMLGFALKVNGQAPRAGRYAGFTQNRLIWFSLLFCGGCAGLAGLNEVAGPIGQLLPSSRPTAANQTVGNHRSSSSHQAPERFGPTSAHSPASDDGGAE